MVSHNSRNHAEIHRPSFLCIDVSFQHRVSFPDRAGVVNAVGESADIGDHSFSFVPAVATAIIHLPIFNPSAPHDQVFH